MSYKSNLPLKDYNITPFTPNSKQKIKSKVYFMVAYKG